MNTTTTVQSIAEPRSARSFPLKEAALLLIYPIGVYRLWKRKSPLWFRLLYTVLGLPVFLIGSAFLALITFAAFLPPVDFRIPGNPPRTVVNSEGNYATTFLKTGRETGGAYELVQVEIEPKGGNDWHYHKAFEEQFTVLKGTLSVGLDGKVVPVKEGETVTAPRKSLHYFKNDQDSTILIRVKVSPARGLEKSIRAAYGLTNTGQWQEGAPFPKNIWHLFLLLGYSETYLDGIPGFIQEPLVGALARVAQWKGEDRDLQPFFR
ncbi:cupin domain-containing protein [Larkinella soli]|uniref:cupin domain-containing protein n=1 Tax=Larkinella soli TaxID=1770527 RepID=UPI000FFBC14B|nr:cupin domain-containing protein [Larkinella soli]